MLVISASWERPPMPYLRSKRVAPRVVRLAVVSAHRRPGRPADRRNPAPARHHHSPAASQRPKPPAQRTHRAVSHRRTVAGGAGQVSPSPTLGAWENPGGHGGMDRPVADRLGLVPGRGEQPGEAAAVLRSPVPAGGGGRGLLRAARGADRQGLGGADPGRVHLQHQGIQPVHPAPHASQGAAGGLARARGSGREGAGVPQGRRPGADRTGVGAVPGRFLTDHQLPCVSVDMPQGYPSSIPPVLAATSDLAVVRMHGRSDKWTSKEIAERFGYRYSEDELAEWAPKIRGLAAEADTTHVVFNNCYSDYAHVNARQLADRLGT